MKKFFSLSKERLQFFILIIVVLSGCAAPQKRFDEGPFEKKAEVKEEKPKIEAKTVKDIKMLIVTSRFYAEKGKMVIFSSKQKDPQKIEERLLKIFANAISAEEIGFSSYKKEEILAQLDSRNVPVFIAIDSKNDSLIVLEIYSVENGEKDSYIIDCPFLKEEKSYSEFVMNLSTEPESACANSKNEIFVTDGKKIVLLDLVDKSEKIVEVCECENPQLSNFGEGAVLFCPLSGRAAKFEKKNGKWEKREINGYPLPERVLRFISVAKDENGQWALFDRKGDILGEFISLSRCIFRETTVFFALSPTGELWGLRGDLILPLYPKEKNLFKKITSSEDATYALSQNGELYKVNLDGDFSIALEVRQTDIEEEIVEIVTIQNELFVFVKTENGYKLYQIYQNGE